MCINCQASKAIAASSPALCADCLQRWTTYANAVRAGFYNEWTARPYTPTQRRLYEVSNANR